MKWHITRNLQTKYISVLVSAISLNGQLDLMQEQKCI